MTQKHSVRVSQVAADIAGFVAWLNSQGHAAEPSDNDANYIDGECCNDSQEADAIANRLWDAFCLSDCTEA